MRWTCWILALIVFATGALSAPKDIPFRPDFGPDVSVLAESATPLEPAVARAMERELRRIFGPSDTRVEIVFDRDRNAHTVYDSQVIMMRVKGRCALGPATAGYSHKPDTLGRTFITDGAVLPFVELDCRQISGAIRQRLATAPAGERPVLLGRALARVLAHEIYHVLAATMTHSATGIAAETMSAEQLACERHDFQPEDFIHMGLLPVLGTH